MAQNGQDEQRLALFIDFENIAIGVRDAHYRKFDVNLVLERLLDKGKLLVKKAYADWSRYSDYKRAFHEAAIELIEVPQKSIGGKNSADIRLVVDAMDMSFQKEHVNCFVIASAPNERQVDSIVENVEEKLRAAGHKPVRREGTRAGRWVLLDFVDMVVHIQHEDERNFYALERLWKDCPTVEVEGLGDHPPTDSAGTGEEGSGAREHGQ